MNNNKISHLFYYQILTAVPNFKTYFKLFYDGKNFIVFRGVKRFTNEDLIIYRTSDKCYNLIYCNSFSNHSERELTNKSFRSINAICDYLNKTLCP